MNWYRHHLFPILEQWAVTPFESKRPGLVKDFKGIVLEPGIGPGLNLPFYSHEVSLVIGVDPSPGMHHRLEKNRSRYLSKGYTPPLTRILEKSAHYLPEIESDSVDHAVLFLTYCSVEQDQNMLSELYRVIKPGGTLAFHEHVVSDHPIGKRIQTFINPVWKMVACGCSLTKDFISDLKSAGFTIVQSKRESSVVMGFAKK